MKVKELDKWHSSKVYDLEGRELNRILKLGKVKNKNVLVISTYGVMSISFKILTSMGFVNVEVKRLLLEEPERNCV